MTPRTSMHVTLGSTTLPSDRFLQFKVQGTTVFSDISCVFKNKVPHVSISYFRYSISFLLEPWRFKCSIFYLSL